MCEAALSFANYRPLFDHRSALNDVNRCLDCCDTSGISCWSFGMGVLWVLVCIVDQLCKGAWEHRAIQVRATSIGGLQGYLLDRVVRVRGQKSPLPERGPGSGVQKTSELNRARESGLEN